MKNLIKAVQAVMQEVSNITKQSTVGRGNMAYKGVRDIDVKQTLKPVMAKHGLVIFPKHIEEDMQVENYTDSYGKPKHKCFVSVKATFLLAHTSGETMEIMGYGHGVDSADKAAGKATTYAMKYALLYTFMIPVGDIDDTDNTHSNDVQMPTKQEQPAKKKVTNQEQWDKLVQWAKGSGLTIEQVKQKVDFSQKQEELFIKALNQ